MIRGISSQAPNLFALKSTPPVASKALKIAGVMMFADLEQIHDDRLQRLTSHSQRCERVAGLAERLDHFSVSVGVGTSTVRRPVRRRKLTGGAARLQIQLRSSAAVPAAELNPDQADLVAAIAQQGVAPGEGVAA